MFCGRASPEHTLVSKEDIKTHAEGGGGGPCRVTRSHITESAFVSFHSTTCTAEKSKESHVSCNDMRFTTYYTTTSHAPLGGHVATGKLGKCQKKVIVDPSPYRLLVRVPDEGTIPIRTSNLITP